MPKIIIHSDVKAGQPMPVLLTIDGEPTVELPLNQEVEVTDEQLVALSHTDHTIELVIEGEAAEAPAAEAPASETVEQEPSADSLANRLLLLTAAAGGSDAGGGGDSGDAATDTSGNAQADPALVTQAEPAADELELTSEQEVAQPVAEGAPADATGPSAGAEQTPAPDAAAATDQVEQPAPVEEQPAADAAPVEQAPAEPTASEKLEQAIELEQEALNELKSGEGTQA